MTGEAYGKIELENPKLEFWFKGRKVYEITPKIYIHLKGFALARVTHLDVEHEFLNGIFSEKGSFLPLKGMEDGFRIVLNKTSKNNITFDRVCVLSSDLNNFLANGKRTFAFVGGKVDGFYIGFKKEYILKLEEIARKKGFKEI
jgi:hypothetical protein